MTSEGSLLIFLFFFFLDFVTSSKAMYMRSVGTWNWALFFFDFDRYSFMYKLCMYVRHVDMKMFDTWLGLNIDFLPTLG